MSATVHWLRRRGASAWFSGSVSCPTASLCIMPYRSHMRYLELTLLLCRTALAARYDTSAGFAIQDIEDYKWEAALPDEGAAIFLMATYGDGEPTDSAADFYSWLVQAAEDADNGIGSDAMLKVIHVRLLEISSHSVAASDQRQGLVFLGAGLTIRPLRRNMLQC